MAIAKGGFRRTLSYKISTDSALSNTIVQDITGSSGRIYFVKAVGGSGDAYIKFYDTDPAVAGTTVPKMGLYVKASTTTEMYIPEGVSFTNSISIYCCGGDVDAATTASPSAAIDVTLVTS